MSLQRSAFIVQSSVVRSLRPCPRNGAAQGKESALADSGWAGEVAAGVGRVRSLAFLSILCGGLLLPQTYRPMKFRRAHRVFRSLLSEIDRKGDVMTDPTRKILRGLSLAGFLLAGCLAIQLTHMSEMNAWAGSPPSPKSTKAAGDAERGRAVFNGKGVCYYCHGIDGNKDQRPQLAADTAALIVQLNPQPVDLRDEKILILKTDKQRARAIREGHPGTGMFPDTTMTNQELTDTLVYLALLRRRGSPKGK